MPVTCQTVINAMETRAPRTLAEEWDNTGLLLGRLDRPVSKVMVTLDVNDEVVEEALHAGVHMIIAHHPLIFKKIAAIRTDQPQGRLFSRLLTQDVSVYAAHTNLDIAPGGINDALADRLQLREVKPLNVLKTEKLLKVVVFVPQSHLEAVRTAMAEAGAGHIGRYSHCTFAANGIGTFLPLSGAQPFIGQPGQLEYTAECRLETVVPERASAQVLKAMLTAHPYEEVAYDVFPLQNSAAHFGLGRIGRLGGPMSLLQLGQYVKEALQLDFVKVAGAADAVMATVAVCGGSGASLLSTALSAGADVLITGDVKYHEAQQAVADGMAVIDAGHFGTEQPGVLATAHYLTQCSQTAQWDVAIMVSKNQKDIFYMV